MDRGEFLKRLCTPEFCHRSLSSPERLMLILGPIVEPTPGLLAFGIPDDFHRRAVGPKPVCHNHFRAAKSFHRFAQKPQSSLAISLLGDENFKDFSFVIDRPPEVINLAVDAYENLIQMPAPLDMAAH